MKCAMHVDFGKQRFQKIGAPVNISDGIDSDTVR